MQIQRTKDWWQKMAEREDDDTVISAGASGFLGVNPEHAERIRANTRVKIVLPVTPLNADAT